MPGELIELAEAPESRRLVSALASLSSSPGLDFVLVGGLAVVARVRSFHRVTHDLDAVVPDDRLRFETRSIEAVTGSVIDRGRLSIGGVLVDVIEVATQTRFEQIAEIDDLADRLFVAAHLFALRDCDPVTITCGGVSSTQAIASARALLATKLSAYSALRRDPAKRPSDAVDLIELARGLVAEGPDHGSEAPPLPDVLRSDVARALQSIVEQPDPMVRRLATSGASIAADEVRGLMGLLLEDLA